MKNIITQFLVKGDFISCIPYGNGHINDTYLIEMNNDNQKEYYILQRINENVFNDVEMLMSNISAVTSFLGKKIKELGGDPNRETLTLVKTKANKSFYRDNTGCYRLYIFIENSDVYQRVEKKEHFYQAGIAIGKFQNLLTDFDVNLIGDVIPDFHNTPKRYQDFCEVVKRDKLGRVKDCRKDINFIHERKEIMSVIVDGIQNKDIPIKVTHNDTKLNNILFDKNTHEAVCVIDLDTIMTGSLLYDFGDAIRFGANTVLEDETDLTKVNFDITLFKEFTKGFLRGINNKITEKEIELLPLSAILMTLECGMRFLTDYLDGDNYFKIVHPKHNLERAKNQLKLVADMEVHYNIMKEFVYQLTKK